jgi:hypothetical protein
MKRISVWSAFPLVLLAFSIFLPTRSVVAQSTISGEITGTVTDATHAVVAEATVILKSTDSAYSQTVTTSSSGTFRFPLLRPGSYNLSVSAKGFREAKTTVDAGVGAVNDVPIQLEVGATTETVEVVATAPPLETENANLTTVWTPSQIENIPNPGGDLTNYALTAPGIVLSTGVGYGNFTANGLPGTSNLYTINGGDMNDPYNNLNNSGSSNNMLGANEIQEVALVTNGYTGQYGRAASVNMNFTTKSGSNSFHGNAKWDWNGRYLNANDWFSGVAQSAGRSLRTSFTFTMTTKACGTCYPGAAPSTFQLPSGRLTSKPTLMRLSRQQSKPSTRLCSRFMAARQAGVRPRLSPSAITQRLKAAAAILQAPHSTGTSTVLRAG